MTVQKISRSLLAAFLMASASDASAQLFRASLPPVAEGGFYAIHTRPDITALCRPQLQDIRVQDGESGHFVPYVIRSGRSLYHDVTFRRFPIEKNTTDSGVTIVDIGNVPDSTVSGLSVAIRNNTAERYASLSGSDDGKRWFVIDEHIRLKSTGNSAAGSFVLSISFPPSRYRFFRMKIENGVYDPLNIDSVGQFLVTDTETAILRTYNALPQLSQVDSNRQSFVEVEYAKPVVADEVWLTFSGPHFFRRSATMRVQSGPADSAWRYAAPLRFEVVSDSEIVLKMARQKVYAAHITIDNADNPPLSLVSAGTSQQVMEIVAWLERDRQYYLTLDPSGKPPRYDLELFRDSIPASLPVLSIGNVSMLPTPQHVESRKPSHRWWIWVALVAGVVLMGSLAYRMLKDHDKR